jgi:hypothetical protein
MFISVSCYEVEGGFRILEINYKLVILITEYQSYLNVLHSVVYR